MSGLFQTLEVMVSVFKTALVKIHPLHPIQCCCYLTECYGILLARCIGSKLVILFVHPPNRPPVARQQNRFWEHIYSITLLFSHLQEPDPVTHIQRHRLHTILLQWTSLHRDVKNRFINNSETACVSHLHTKQHQIFYELLLAGFGSSSGQPPVNMEAFIAITHSLWCIRPRAALSE